MIFLIGTMFKTGSSAAKKQSMNKLYIRFLFKIDKDVIPFIVLKIIIPTTASRIRLVIKEASKIDRTGAIV